MAASTLVTDRYQVGEDDPSYDDLIKHHIVLDASGRVAVVEHSPVEGLNEVVYVKSGRGYYDVWRSNAQKMVRRGLEEGALKSLVETASTNATCASNILNRFFQVMVSEDIGWAEPQLPLLAASLLKRYYDNKELLHDTSFQQEIIRGVQILTRAKKSRYVDYLCHLASIRLGNLGTIPPSEPLIQILADKSNPLLSRVMAVVLLHRSSEQGKIPPSADPRLVRKRKVVFLAWQYLLAASRDLDNRRKVGNLVNTRLRRQVSALLDLYLLPGGESILSLIHAVVLVSGEERKILQWRALPKVETSPTWDEVMTWDIWPAACAYDKHTQVGRMLGRDERWFYRYGGKISNCVVDYEEEELNALQAIINA